MSELCMKPEREGGLTDEKNRHGNRVVIACLDRCHIDKKSNFSTATLV